MALLTGPSFCFVSLHLGMHNLFVQDIVWKGDRHNLDVSCLVQPWHHRLGREGSLFPPGKAQGPACH